MKLKRYQYNYLTSGFLSSTLLSVIIPLGSVGDFDWTFPLNMFKIHVTYIDETSDEFASLITSSGILFDGSFYLGYDSSLTNPYARICNVDGYLGNSPLDVFRSFVNVNDSTDIRCVININTSKINVSYRLGAWIEHWAEFN